MPIKCRTFGEFEERGIPHNHEWWNEEREIIYIGKDKYNTEDMRNPLDKLYQIKKYIKKEFEKLKNDNIAQRIIPNSIAKIEIIHLLKKYKLKGLNQINTLQISSQLNLPIIQVDNILDILEKENIIRDIE